MAGNLSAETVMIEATQDNTLYENPQGELSNGAGDYMFVGRTQGGAIRRALIAFKDLSAIPAGATITSVKLHFSLSKERSSSTNLRLSRVLADWGEGASHAPGEEGAGGGAATGDATWIHTFFSTQTWQTAGGDFFGSSSAELTVNATGAYTLCSTPELVADVQDWLANPGDNFGWIMTAGESGTTSKRLTSRTNGTTANHPMIEVEFDSTIHDYSGAWFDPTLDGEGYLIFKTEFGWIIYFFGYGPDMQRLWLISDVVQVGTPVFGQTYAFTMFVGEGGDFELPTKSEDMNEWGSLTVNFTDCGNGVFVLASDTLQKISNVLKIVGIEGTQCGA
jgi:hypothetical protein